MPIKMFKMTISERLDYQGFVCQCFSVKILGSRISRIEVEEYDDSFAASETVDGSLLQSA